MADESKSDRPEDLSSQKEFIVAYSGVNTAKVACIIISVLQIINNPFSASDSVIALNHKIPPA